MSDRPEDGGESHANAPYVASSGRCRLIAAARLTCVCPVSGGYIGVEFEAGEEHAYDRLQWRNKNGTAGHGFVVRTGDGDAYLMECLFERYCQVVSAELATGTGEMFGHGEAGQQEHAVAPPAPTPRPAPKPTAQPARRVRVVNVKGLNKPAQRAGIVYVGRKFAGWPEHELHNPFKPVAGEPVGTCLAKYRASLASRLTLDDDLAALWAETEQGKRPLGCWCCNWDGQSKPAPECHAVILATMLMARFGDLR